MVIEERGARPRVPGPAALVLVAWYALLVVADAGWFRWYTSRPVDYCGNACLGQDTPQFLAGCTGGLVIATGLVVGLLLLRREPRRDVAPALRGLSAALLSTLLSVGVLAATCGLGAVLIWLLDQVS